MLDVEWLYGLMSELASTHPIFHNESYFQHELAGLLHRSGTEIQKEHTIRIGTESYRLDLWLPGKGVAIELKYRSKELTIGLDTHQGAEPFQLKSQGAPLIARYSFLSDVQKLERLHDGYEGYRLGYAVFLTKDPSYWKEPSKEGNIDECFQLHQGRYEITGKLEWKHGDTGTGAGRSPLCLSGTYCPKWQHYWKFDVENNGLFKYLAFQVPSPESKGGAL